MTSIKNSKPSTLFGVLFLVLGLTLTTIGGSGLLDLLKSGYISYVINGLLLTLEIFFAGIGYLVSAFVLFKFKGFTQKWSGYVLITTIILTVLASPYFMMYFLALVMCGGSCGSL